MKPPAPILGEAVQHYVESGDSEARLPGPEAIHTVSGEQHQIFPMSSSALRVLPTGLEIQGSRASFCLACRENLGSVPRAVLPPPPNTIATLRFRVTTQSNNRKCLCCAMSKEPQLGPCALHDTFRHVCISQQGQGWKAHVHLCSELISATVWGDEDVISERWRWSLGPGFDGGRQEDLTIPVLSHGKGECNRNSMYNNYRVPGCGPASGGWVGKTQNLHKEFSSLRSWEIAHHSQA